MAKILNVIGNGKSASLYEKAKNGGATYTCNLPGFNIPEAKATFMVDFKMMNAIDEGSVIVPGEWILGKRPQMWCEQKPNFYLKYAPQIKEFYTTLPKYVANYTDLSCGHMAVHYCANKLKADEIHMFGFDSIFDFDLYSSTDFYLGSDRGVQNNARLTNNWRPVWGNMWKEFSNTKFVLYHFHDNVKVKLPDNVEVVVIEKNKKKK